MTTQLLTVSRFATTAVTTALLLSATPPLCTIVSAADMPYTDHSSQVSSREVVDTLRHTSGILQASATANMVDDRSVVTANTAEDTVDIPKDATQGVSVTPKDGPDMGISLPNADQAGSGQEVAPGVIAYSSSDGSANAVQANTDGSVRMLTVIDNAKASRTYDYKITVPDGGRVALTSDGGAVILDVGNNVLAHVNAPWAKDARGKAVKTWFTTDGVTLTQHVKHTVRGIAYPVIADPYFDWHWYGVNIYIEQPVVNRMLALMSSGSGAMGLGAAITGGAGTPAAAVGAAALAIGSGAMSWCSAHGNGMWIHMHLGVSWCNG